MHSSDPPPPRSRRRSGQTTIAEVARLAGVSTMTVSHIINGTKAVRAETREAVRRAIVETGYVPNPAARLLATAGGQRIALLHPDVNNDYLSAILIGAMQAAGEIGATLLLQPYAVDRRGDAAGILSAAQRLRVDGILAPAPLCEALDALGAGFAAMPVVGVAPGRALRHLSAVRVDEERAMYEATGLLLAAPERRFGFLAGPPDHASSIARETGFFRALRDAGIDPRSVLREESDYTFEGALPAAAHLLDRSNPPQAIVAANDDMAAAVLLHGHRIGLTMPADLAVIGFDDGPIATRVFPTLTTARQPLTEMARLAMLRLQREITAAKNAAPLGAEDILCPHEIIRRASSGRLRPGSELPRGARTASGTS